VAGAMLTQQIDCIKAGIDDPRQGLPEELFLFVSSLTPMINVDLLIKNEQNETLLTWREDNFYGPGWHIPGGIIRFKESASSRILAVARRELGTEVDHDSAPLRVTEIMAPLRNTRGHFISLLYRCRLKTTLDTRLRFSEGEPHNGQWQWFSACPGDLIPQHVVYRDYMGSV
jgi:colanic acid biosynthesis protein WcaH